MRILLSACFALCAAAAPLAAQERAWEIEAAGGLVAGRTVGTGTWAVPPAGPALVTSNPTFPTRQVSTWFFGDGASLVNGVNADFGVTERVSPLETTIPSVGSRHAGVLAFRVRRRLNDRVAAEFSVDTLAKSDDDFGPLTSAIETTRASFVSAFQSLFSTGPFASVSVNATGTTSIKDRRDTAFTGAFNVRLARWHAFAPYATAGAGVLTGSGALPSAALEGHYRALILGQFPIDETDRLSLQYQRGSSFVMVLGGGVRHDVSPRWGWRGDARVIFGPDSTRVLIDATPSTVRGTPASFIESFTNPAIQFSNDPAIGRQSSLSGPPIVAFEAFTGGMQSRTIVTFGVFLKL